VKTILAALFLALSSVSCATTPTASVERILVEFSVQPGQRAEFIEELHKILVDTRAFEGCLAATVWTHELDSDTVWIYEEWEARENQVAYVTWRGETGNTAHLGPYLTGPPRFLWLNEHQ